MATTITPQDPVDTLEEALAFLSEVESDVEPTLTEREFIIELVGKTYTVRMPEVQENPRRVWDLTVSDNGDWPGRTNKYLGHQWHWETIIQTVKTDVTRFFPTPP